MLICSMSVSVDGFINDREGAFDWTAPSDELFRFHLAQVGELGGYLLGRRLYETMQVWETDPKLRYLGVRGFEWRMLDEAYTVPLLWWQRIVVMRSNVKGWGMTPSHLIGQDLETVWLKP